MIFWRKHSVHKALRPSTSCLSIKWVQLRANEQLMLSRLAAIIMAGREARGKLLGHSPQGTVLITPSPKAKCGGANEIGRFHLCIWMLLVTIWRLSFWMNLIFPLRNIGQIFTIGLRYPTMGDVCDIKPSAVLGVAVHNQCPAFTIGHRPAAQLVVKPGNGRPHTLEEWGLCSTQRSISVVKVCCWWCRRSGGWPIISTMTNQVANNAAQAGVKWSL